MFFFRLSFLGQFLLPASCMSLQSSFGDKGDSLLTLLGRQARQAGQDRTGQFGQAGQGRQAILTQLIQLDSLWPPLPWNLVFLTETSFPGSCVHWCVKPGVSIFVPEETGTALKHSVLDKEKNIIVRWMTTSGLRSLGVHVFLSDAILLTSSSNLWYFKPRA